MSQHETFLKNQIPHVLPEFHSLNELVDISVCSFRDNDCESWHNEFVRRVFQARRSRTYLPVFRISHGEFIMAVGNRFSKAVSFRHAILERLSFLRQFVKSKMGLGPAFYSGSNDNTHESFTMDELEQAKQIYVESLREIAENGILAVAFNNTPGYVSYIRPYLQWLVDNRVSFSSENYVPFYSVYALIFGSTGRQLFENQNVLIITSLPKQKEEAIRESLLKLGVAGVQFYGVSESKAMFDKIDLQVLAEPVNVVLVGAGVGAASILRQLKPLKAVSIDAGFAIDALAFPAKRWNRPYCVPDAEFDREKVAFI